MNNEHIVFVEKFRFLGVYIDSKLKWKYHIDVIVCKIAKLIGMMNKIKHYVNKNTMINLYCIFISPYLNYCNIAWGNAARIYLNKLHVLQKRIIRIICNVHFREHTKKLFVNLNVLNVFDIYKYNVNLFMFKHYKNMLPLPISQMFKFIPAVTRYPTRSHSLYTDIYCRTEMRKRTIVCVGTSSFNSLLNCCLIDLRNILTVSAFKRSLKQLLIDDMLRHS